MFRSLYDAGVRKIIEGVTTIEEVQKIVATM